MKKIINGKRYDTDTAKLIGSDGYSNPSDFDYWSEDLYQKKTGEFFLYGEGGARTKYAQAIDSNSWCGGERIMPLSFQDAREWVEDHLDADTYEEVFGPVAEDDSRKTVGFSLPVSVADTLKRMAAESGRTQSDIVAELIDREVQSEGLITMSYVFEEYRDKAGTGTEKKFDNKYQALDYAQREWDHLVEHDKESYRKDPCGYFRVCLYPVTWDGDEWNVETGDGAVKEIWSAL